jgi:hypothetical protein
MTLQEASKKYSVAGLDLSALETQEEAFQTCLSFLAGVTKIKSQNTAHSSYSLKHIVENPAGRFGIPSSVDCYTCYIYEGTFILAALASGFTMRQRSPHLKATFNMSERSLREAAKAAASNAV